jgi:hypothetical protein
MFARCTKFTRSVLQNFLHALCKQHRQVRNICSMKLTMRHGENVYNPILFAVKAYIRLSCNGFAVILIRELNNL